MCCSAKGARTHWLLGFPDLALRRAREALELARQLQHPTTLAWALSDVALLHQLRQDVEAARDVAGEGLAVAAEHDVASPQLICRFAWGWAVARTGRHSEGLAALTESRALLEASGTEFGGPHYLGMIAELCGGPERVEIGLEAVSSGLARTAETGERYYEAELHRLRGELLRVQRGEGAFAEADACFRRALEIAGEQRARAWQLRAAMSLVRLWRGRGGDADARGLLADVYAAFGEGFDTKDLLEARALLART